MRGAWRETGRGSVLSFLSGKETGCAVLSFLSGKEKKEPKKRNLNGEGDERKQSGGPPRSVRFPSIGRPPRLALPIFPCGAFLKEKPRKIFFAGNVRSADGREQRANPGGFMAFFSGSLFFPRKEKRTEEKPRKIFLQGMCVPLTGGRSGCFRGGFPAFFSGSLFFLRKEKRTKKPSGKKRERILRKENIKTRFVGRLPGRVRGRAGRWRRRWFFPSLRGRTYRPRRGSSRRG